ncbi:hypothetical protein CBM2587_B10142 [Cupriavidus taiwanensis]|uniref:Uncharacterized protein n=1 Tax=Cupriavidus taiwanensis TaxID=164546 RepID=A0A975X4B4_9BURK|nr:hypothetical protein CBM2587_B10142 [Cupriavidus taiwanensis]
MPACVNRDRSLERFFFALRSIPEDCIATFLILMAAIARQPEMSMPSPSGSAVRNQS